MFTSNPRPRLLQRIHLQSFCALIRLQKSSDNREKWFDGFDLLVCLLKPKFSVTVHGDLIVKIIVWHIVTYKMHKRLLKESAKASLLENCSQ